MSLYILGMGNISPQKTWEDETLLSQAFDYQNQMLTSIEPDYEQWIAPQQLRRMSRIIKMGVTAAKMALQDAGVEVPDAIITGTGYGCIADTNSFLIRMIENHEQALNPTPFMQSTHNTIGSQIALLLQCQGYNQTYTQESFSFESALTDALLHAAENPAQRILVGGIDEITELSHVIQSRFGIFRRTLRSSLDLFRKPGKGTVNGEGSAFFLLSAQCPERGRRVCLEGVKMLYKPSQETLAAETEHLLKTAGLRRQDVDFVLSGHSGDARLDAATAAFCKSVFPSASIGLFKHLSGEFPTASAFALWLSTRIIEHHHVPDFVIYRDMSRPMRNIVVYNPYFGTHHSLLLIRAC